jgi:hypothetical protein
VFSNSKDEVLESSNLISKGLNFLCLTNEVHELTDLTSEFDDLSGTKSKVLAFLSSKDIIIKFLSSISGVLEVKKFPREPQKKDLRRDSKKKKFTRITPFSSTPRTFARMISSMFFMVPRKRHEVDTEEFLKNHERT